MEWIPTISIGDIVFGQAIPSGIDVRQCEETGSDWDSCEILGEKAFISCEAGIVQTVECWKEIHLHGKNLLEMNFEEIKRVVGGEWIEKSSDCSTCEEKCITIWFDNDFIDSATVWGVDLGS